MPANAPCRPRGFLSLIVVLWLALSAVAPARPSSPQRASYTPPAGLARFQWAQEHHYEMRTLWLDATANLERLSTREGVADILDKAVAAGFNTVGVGVKTSCGFALYNSRLAPRMGTFLGRFTYPKGYDLLQTVLEEGHKRGLEVHALLMVFSDGRKLDRSGPAYGPHAAWQTIQLLANGRRTKQSDVKPGTFVFLNPTLPAVQEYEIAVIREIASRYPVDGIALDRLRYSGIDCDFSDASRAAFEKFLGRPVKRFPADVMTMTARGPRPGRLYKQWLEFRAATIAGFVRRAAKVVRAVRPTALIGCSVGAWYPTYVNEGVNWGSVRYNPGKEFFWANATYRRTGYADSIDYLAPHCYSRYIEMEEAEDAGRPSWNSVQGGAQLSRQAVANACWVYGGVYAQDYKGRPDEFVRAMRAVREETNGVMAFDVSQIEEFNWWPLFKQVFSTPAQPPHRRPGWLARAPVGTASPIN